MSSHSILEVVIIGAGPAGVACAIAAHQAKVDYLVIEKGCLANSIFNFPSQMYFFSTPDLLEIGDVPLIVQSEKPTRHDMLKYYRVLVKHYNLNIRLFEKVEGVQGRKGDFSVRTEHAVYKTRHVIAATGQYDNPNLLNIPGEDSDKVSHYYSESHPFYRKKVAIIGGKNTAVEAALDLYKNDAEVTLIHRGDGIGKSVKYWILPDIQNRIRDGKIKAHFNHTVKEIRERSIIIRDEQGRESELENDFVFALTGYSPDRPFLTGIGIEMVEGNTPVHDPNTLETNVPGIYIAGVISAGSDGSKVFIENSRNHGLQIMRNILNGKY